MRELELEASPPGAAREARETGEAVGSPAAGTAAPGLMVA